MLLKQLKNARLKGDSWLAPTTEPDYDNLQDNLTRLSLGPSLIEHPSTIKSSAKRRCNNAPSADRAPRNCTRSKRMRIVEISFAHLDPVKFPTALLNAGLISEASSWDAPPIAPLMQEVDPFSPSSPAFQLDQLDDLCGAKKAINEFDLNMKSPLRIDRARGTTLHAPINANA